jgi:hypothetical protein
VAFGAVLLLASPASAARLLQVYIEKDGEVVAHTYYGDNGRVDTATIWRYLATPPIMVFVAILTLLGVIVAVVLLSLRRARGQALE